MVSISVHATGVIFPIEEKINTSYLCHKISDGNELDYFYTVPIKVTYSKDETYFSWKKEFDKKVKIGMARVKKVGYMIAI